MSGPIWSSTKELLEYLVDEAPFEISFVNHPESEVIGVHHRSSASVHTTSNCEILLTQTCPAVANMMDSVTPNGEILYSL
jgi:hypothetical protein